MHPRALSAEAPTRNPIARSLALAVLGIAFVAAALTAGLVFALLLGVLVVGYLVKLAHAWWRMLRIRRRAVLVDAAPPAFEREGYTEGELAVVEATDAARRGSGGPT